MVKRHIRVIARVERYGFAKTKSNGKHEPGFRLCVERREMENTSVINTRVSFYYNNGNNVPTQIGTLPFFCRDKARWAAKQLR